METRPAVWESREQLESAAAHARGFATRAEMHAHFDTSPATEDDDYRRRLLALKRIVAK
jgi:hypothetical protein